jgi:ABC-type antimicrobial peptide transport system permease subunit
VVSFSVAQRTREVGIRMALGADRPALTALVFRDGMTLTLFGLALGAAVAIPLTRVMGSLLYGVTALDPTTLTLVPLVLGGVAGFAISIPVGRAVRVDPNVALKGE